MPSSALVSEIPDAAPARSGGAAAMMRSVVRVIARLNPMDIMMNAVTMVPRGAPVATRVSTAIPTAETSIPPVIT
jgi:hypothetical protein